MADRLFGALAQVLFGRFEEEARPPTHPGPTHQPTNTRLRFAARAGVAVFKNVFEFPGRGTQAEAEAAAGRRTDWTALAEAVFRLSDLDRWDSSRHVYKHHCTSNLPPTHWLRGRMDPSHTCGVKQQQDHTYTQIWTGGKRERAHCAN